MPESWGKHKCSEPWANARAAGLGTAIWKLSLKLDYEAINQKGTVGYAVIHPNPMPTILDGAIPLSWYQ